MIVNIMMSEHINKINISSFIGDNGTINKV